MGGFMSTLAARFTILAVLGAFGCKEQDRNYCADALHHNCLNVDAAITQCTSDQECSPNVCDLTGTKACVQCTIANPTACTATTPICGTNNACRSCAAHAECGSSACLADGSCATEANVAYVAAGGSGTCGKADPCGTLDIALQTGRPYVKFAAGLVKDNKTTTIDGKTVTILADAGAKLDRDGDGPILVVQNSSPANTSVQIFDLEITGATGVPGGDGIRLTANGRREPGNRSCRCGGSSHGHPIDLRAEQRGGHLRDERDLRDRWQRVLRQRSHQLLRRRRRDHHGIERGEPA
jgi:hypothetical protein